MAMVSAWLGSKELTTDQQAVRAGTPEIWDVVDDGSRFSVLVVPLPNVDQAIVHSPRLAHGSPILINTRLSAPYSANLEEVRRSLGIPMCDIDGTHLTFIWMWQSAQDVLKLEKTWKPMLPNTINVAPWRLVLAEGIDNACKRRLALEHKLPFLENDLNHTKETLAKHFKSAVKPGMSSFMSSFMILDETQTRYLCGKRDKLTLEIAEARSELEGAD